MKSEHPSGPIQVSAPIAYADPLPDECDVAVIGAGVIGVFTALYLARAGQKVVLLEKGRIACEQSSRNWGWVRQQGRDYDELPIMMEASRLWEEAEKDTGGRTGWRVRHQAPGSGRSQVSDVYQVCEWVGFATSVGSRGCGRVPLPFQKPWQHGL